MNLTSGCCCRSLVSWLQSGMDRSKTEAAGLLLVTLVLLASTAFAEPQMYRWAPDGNLWNSEAFSFDPDTGITWGYDRGIQGPSIIRPVPGMQAPVPLMVPRYHEAPPVGGDPMDLWPEEYQLLDQGSGSPFADLPPGF